MRRISIVFALVTLIATISVMTTMTMVQADPTGDLIIIQIEGPADPQVVTSIVLLLLAHWSTAVTLKPAESPSLSG